MTKEYMKDIAKRRINLYIDMFNEAETLNAKNKWLDECLGLLDFVHDLELISDTKHSELCTSLYEAHHKFLFNE